MMSDWIKWEGGTCPVLAGTMVHIQLRSGIHNKGPAKVFTWKNNGGQVDIISYKVIKKDQKLDDGWRVNKMGRRPVNANVLVEIKNRDGQLLVASAGDFRWQLGILESGEDILEYRQVTDRPAAKIADGWLWWEGGVCPVGPEEIVEVRLRAGGFVTRKASTFYWGMKGHSVDILEYRIVEVISTPRAKIILPVDPTTKTPTAPELLQKALGHMEARAATYDKPGGERSMGPTVAAFNIMTNRDLTESEGWLLMQILKDVRDRQCTEPHADSLEDCVAYSSLKAEARLREKKP